METKYVVLNPDNWEITLPDLQIRIEAKWSTEIPREFAVLLTRQFEVRQITIEWGVEIDNVNYREFLENSKKIKAEEKETVKKKSTK